MDNKEKQKKERVSKSEKKQPKPKKKQTIPEELKDMQPVKLSKYGHPIIKLSDEMLEVYKKHGIINRECEECGSDDAMLRHWSGECLCDSCAHYSFKRFLLLLSSITVIVAGLVLGVWFGFGNKNSEISNYKTATEITVSIKN